MNCPDEEEYEEGEELYYDDDGAFGVGTPVSDGAVYPGGRSW